MCTTKMETYSLQQLEEVISGVLDLPEYIISKTKKQKRKRLFTFLSAIGSVLKENGIPRDEILHDIDPDELDSGINNRKNLKRVFKYFKAKNLLTEQATFYFHWEGTALVNGDTIVKTSTDNMIEFLLDEIYVLYNKNLNLAMDSFHIYNIENNALLSFDHPGILSFADCQPIVDLIELKNGK